MRAGLGAACAQREKGPGLVRCMWCFGQESTRPFRELGRRLGEPQAWLGCRERKAGGSEVLASFHQEFWFKMR